MDSVEGAACAIIHSYGDEVTASKPIDPRIVLPTVNAELDVAVLRLRWAQNIATRLLRDSERMPDLHMIVLGLRAALDRIEGTLQQWEAVVATAADRAAVPQRNSRYRCGVEVR
ncbi:hypothetical protein [Paractinoplanes maris]|uniref:hypothetical protein n=1 Tax=Paractinoplanes maris TaxID=1734446 RepID=UPI00201FEF72|nr:hypothetical protein [Actinoplanes maris]